MNETLSKALASILRYLSRRDHSAAELRSKMQRRFDQEVIDQALAFAEQRGWLLPPEILAQNAAATLGRKKKSHVYIQNALSQRGLPTSPLDTESEIEKIRQLLQSKFVHSTDLSYEEKAKAYKFLINRGFEDAMICRVLNEKFQD